MCRRLVKYQMKPLQTLQGSRPCQATADTHIASVCSKCPLKPKETQNVSRACQVSAATHSNARTLYPHNIHFSFLRMKIKYQMAQPLFCFTAVCANHTCKQGIAHNITPSRHSTPDLKIDCVMCLHNAIAFVLNNLLI